MLLVQLFKKQGQNKKKKQKTISTKKNSLNVDHLEFNIFVYLNIDSFCLLSFKWVTSIYARPHQPMNEWIMNRWIGRNDRLYLTEKININIYFIFAMRCVIVRTIRTKLAFCTAPVALAQPISFSLALPLSYSILSRITQIPAMEDQTSKQKPNGFACSFTYFIAPSRAERNDIGAREKRRNKNKKKTKHITTCRWRKNKIEYDTQAQAKERMNAQSVCIDCRVSQEC